MNAESIAKVLQGAAENEENNGELIGLTVYNSKKPDRFLLFGDDGMRYEVVVHEVSDTYFIRSVDS